MGEIRKSLRYRINVSKTTKDIKTWDCTVELEQTQELMIMSQADKSMQDTLELSDKLVKELESRYPLVVEEKKGVK